MIDIHCHLLPGIDDGPRNWEDSLDLCRAMVADGIKKAVATPHLIDGVWDNLRSRVEPLAAELNKRLATAAVALEVLSGGEVDISSHLIAEASAELPAIGGKALLLEMPVAVVPAAMAETIFAVRAAGLIPILAHPERNRPLQERPRLAHEWISSGACLQLDGDSLLGVWGRGAKRLSERMLVEGLFHAMASDAHSIDRRPPRLTEALARARKLVGDEADKLVSSGPEMLLAGEEPPTPLYRPANQVGPGSSKRRRRGLLARIFG